MGIIPTKSWQLTLLRIYSLYHSFEMNYTSTSDTWTSWIGHALSFQNLNMNQIAVPQECESYDVVQKIQITTMKVSSKPSAKTGLAVSMGSSTLQMYWWFLPEPLSVTTYSSSTPSRSKNPRRVFLGSLKSAGRDILVRSNFSSPSSSSGASSL